MMTRTCPSPSTRIQPSSNSFLRRKPPIW